MESEATSNEHQHDLIERPLLKSYTSKTVGWNKAIGNFLSQYRALKKRTDQVDNSMAEFIEGYKEAERQIGIDLSKCDILELGHGQLPLQMAFFTCRAKSAIGIDIDIVPNGLNPAQYLRLFKKNGFKRTIKTAARETLGFNRQFRDAFVRAMNIKQFPKLDLRQGDATHKIDLPDNSIDVVYSTDVFEHLSKPENAIREIKRVLRPSGVVVTRTLHWAHYNALHDIRVIVGEIQGRWAHLRPSIESETEQGAYVNEIRINQWLELFADSFENMSSKMLPVKSEELEPLKKELSQARQSGELLDYSDEELLTYHLLIRCENSFT